MWYVLNKANLFNHDGPLGIFNGLLNKILDGFSEGKYEGQKQLRDHHSPCLLTAFCHFHVSTDGLFSRSSTKRAFIWFFIFFFSQLPNRFLFYIQCKTMANCQSIHKLEAKTLEHQLTFGFHLQKGCQAISCKRHGNYESDVKTSQENHIQLVAIA